MSPTEFEVIYRAEIDAVWAFLRRLGLEEPALRDVCHDVFLVAWDKRVELAKVTSRRGWLLGIAVRKAANLRAKASAHREVLQDEVEAVDARGNSEIDARLDAETIVRKAMAKMTFEARTVFLMHELEGRPVPEIAELMNTPVGTAYTRLRAARLALGEVVRGGAS